MVVSEKWKKGIFDGDAAQRGYALNKMMYSLNDAACRKKFLNDREAYCDRFGLDEEQKQAVLSGNRDALVAAGASMYFGIKLVRTYRRAAKGKD